MLPRVNPRPGRKAFRNAARHKMTLLLAPELVAHIERTCGRLGINKSPFVVAAVAYLCAVLDPMVRDKNLSALDIQRLLDESFQKMISRRSPAETVSPRR